MFQHFSYLFEPRPLASEANINAQAKLCKDVLESIILTAAHRLQPSIAPETWENWLRLILGITDSVFMFVL